MPPCEAELQQHDIISSVCIRGEDIGWYRSADHNPAPENGLDLINNQYEIIWFEGLQLPDTLELDRSDAQCEDDNSAVVLSSEDEHGELSSENNDNDAGDDY